MCQQQKASCSCARHTFTVHVSQLHMYYCRRGQKCDMSTVSSRSPPGWRNLSTDRNVVISVPFLWRTAQSLVPHVGFSDNLFLMAKEIKGSLPKDVVPNLKAQWWEVAIVVIAQVYFCFRVVLTCFKICKNYKKR